MKINTLFYYYFTIPLIFVIPFTIKILAKVGDKPLSNINDDDDNKSLNFITEKVLLSIISNVHQLIIDASSYHEVSNKRIYDFFIKQNVSPICVYTDCSLKNIEYDNFGIVTSIHKLFSLECDFYKSGVYFFVMDYKIENETNLIVDNLRKLWQYYEVHEIYLISLKDIKLFLPFELEYNSNKNWGIVMPLHMQNLELRRNKFKNLNYYPVRVQIFRSVLAEMILDEKTKKILKVYGTDAEVMYLLRDKMNFTMILQEPDKNYFGLKLPNGSFIGGIGLLIRNETDIVITGYFIKDYNTRDVEYTVGVYDDRLCIFVPKSERIPPTILPLFSVGYEMWICYIVVAFLCGTILCLFNWANMLNFNFKLFGVTEILQIYVDTWIIWVRVGLIKLPKYKSGRIFLLSVSIVSVIFGAIFESSLATVYTKPLFYPDINTLQQLAKKGYKILYKYESMKDDLFPKNVSATYDYLDSKMTLSNKNVSLVKSMVEKKNFASVNRWLGLQLQDSNYFTRKVLHVIPECPKLYMLSYVLQKNSPYAERINNLLLEFLASGLLNYWTNQRKLKEYLAHLKEPLNENNFAKVLSLRDLQLSFYVLAVGNLFGFLILCLEIIKNRKETDKKKSKSKKLNRTLKVIVQIKK